MAGLYDDTTIPRLQAVAEALAPRWGMAEGARARLLNVSENATFRLDSPADGAPMVVRLHRPGYHTRPEIESELAWIEALRAEGWIETPAVHALVDRDGHVAAFEFDGGIRYAVGFAYMSGEEPTLADDLSDDFRRLGAINAKLHQHARRWPRPDGFVRKTWDFATTIGPRPHWGDWRAALGLTPDGKAILERVCATLERDLTTIGQGPERFGLIHADLRLANLLMDGGRIGVIDFDDCGFGWYLYDFAAAISFYETDPSIPKLQEAWLDGYRAVAPLSDDEALSLPTMVMLRRLLLTAWIASHAETPTAQEFGSGYTDGTVALAESYLAARATA